MLPHPLAEALAPWLPYRSSRVSQKVADHDTNNSTCISPWKAALSQLLVDCDRRLASQSSFQLEQQQNLVHVLRLRVAKAMVVDVGESDDASLSMSPTLTLVAPLTAVRQPAAVDREV